MYLFSSKLRPSKTRTEKRLQAVAHESGSDAGFLPPVFQLKVTGSGRPLQLMKSVPVVQREEPKGEDQSKGADIDFTLLPPEVRLSFWRMLMTANKKGAGISYSGGKFGAGLGYQYGGSVVGKFSYGDFKSSVEVDTGSGALTLGGSAGGFNFSGNAGFSTGSYGLGLSYGAPLLPFPWELSKPVYGAERGAMGIGAGLPTAMDNPLGFYDSQKKNLDAVTKAYSLLDKVRDQQATGIRFGAGLRLTYDPKGGLFVMFGVQGSF